MKTTFYIRTALLSIFSLAQLFAQKHNEPTVVNYSIEDTLSPSERDYYQLFPKYKEFQFAVFYLNSDSTINAEVHYLNNGISTDTLIQNYRSLKSLNYHINARNAFENKLSVSENKSFVQNKGDNVSVFKTDNFEESGELLYVRRNSLLLLKQECKNNVLDPNYIDNIKREEIDKIVIKGNSNLGLGMGLGILASVIVGAFIFKSYDDGSFMWAYDAIAPTIISMVGCISFGVIIGISTSTPDEIINPRDKYEYQRLIDYSRYKFNEPVELKIIQ